MIVAPPIVLRLDCAEPVNAKTGPKVSVKDCVASPKPIIEFATVSPVALTSPVT